MSTVWIGFLLSIIVLLIVSRKDLSLSLFIGSLVLGLITLSPKETADSLYHTLINPSYILFSCALGLFPILGALLKEIGAFDDLIENLRLGKKAFMAFSASLIGLLPVPGGALLSAPIIKKVAGKLPNEISFAINIWFRHVLIMIYPIGPALLVPVKIANLNVYDVILYLFPFFIFMVLLGYFFLLRSIKDNIAYEGKSNPKKLIIPLALILMPPVVDYIVKNIYNTTLPEAITFFAVLCSVITTIMVGRLKVPKIKNIIIGAKFWKFIFIMLTMFMFIDMFQKSGVGELISQLNVPNVVLCVGIGFFLAFVTGRTQLSASVVIPTYLSANALTSMPLVTFAVTFVSIFLGYLISPLHPCISVSLEYYDITLEKAIRTMAIMTAVAVLITILIFLMF